MQYSSEDLLNFIEDNDLPLVKSIVSGQPDLYADLEYDKRINDPLNCCIECGTVEMFIYLFNSRKNKDLAQLLYYAGWENQFEIAKFLLQQGAPVDASDSAIITPMMAAVTFKPFRDGKAICRSGRKYKQNAH